MVRAICRNYPLILCVFSAVVFLLVPLVPCADRQFGYFLILGSYFLGRYDSKWKSRFDISHANEE